MPLVVKLVVIGEAMPLDIVIAPLSVVYAVDTWVEVVPTIIPGIAKAGRQRGLVARVFKVGRLRIERVSIP